MMVLKMDLGSRLDENSRFIYLESFQDNYHKLKCNQLLDMYLAQN